MTTTKLDCFQDLLDYVFDEANMYKKEKYLGGRVMNGTAFDKETQLRLQYCVGGFFVEGWIDNTKLRIYGHINNGWVAYYCHASDVIDEGAVNGTFKATCLGRNNSKETLRRETLKHVHIFSKEIR